MKKLLLSFALILMGVSAFSQQRVRELDEINEDNSWLKLGVNLGAPVGDLSNYSSFALGLDVAGQFMRTDNFGLGVASGYTQYFKKSDVSYAENFGVIPLGVMFRYYPQPSGFFVGTDAGYSFFTGDGMSESGGAYIRPQLGYHNYDWNIFGFYNHVFNSDPGIDVQAIGVAVTYNIRFK
ncbi:hypothetical protein [Algoriphagus zhangzhouensis]|uniref:Outer membrane protein beta-barrel domain-containing protein n=1 Tax=Algoriphagus zhangzhouensis TaxID=1073327 RepID=A0A1M7ZFS4_9BACT|nr:hypothetical protein [Algoriphagus zhangzhouensis]TDY44944.1 hypothetical protein A8938_3158 [Algoriphagus zhangzhouensis]SHO63765.1 hypothetical protein SAMN04488108_2927 [Algoriphagus zhangzhouensis]